MDYDPAIWHEWRDSHWLSRASLHWIREHPEAGDPDPITTAIAALRALDAELA